MTNSTQSATDALIEYVTTCRAEDISEAATSACRTFLLDSLGVAIAGSAAPWARQLLEMQSQWGAGDDARSWVFGNRLPAPAAAFTNAYQIHNSEFDCIHEAAVVHPMAVTLPALMAVAEREGDISGETFLAALTIGVEVACTIGVSATGGMRFFRPATAGAFGAVAAIGWLRGFNAETMRSAFGVVYGQMSGNMQAHTEGSVLLAMQVGFNARNAVTACDIAAAGIDAPREMFEGEFGYFKLFEESDSFAPVVAGMGSSWRITETAHKPFPSGRATHGVLDAVLELQRDSGFAASDISHIEARVPPLTFQLVGRKPHPELRPNEARLCISYVVARALRDGGLGVDDFTPEALTDAETQDLASRVEVSRESNPNPSALTPVKVTVTLRNGDTLERTQNLIYGNPAKPMTREAHLAKFRTNWRSSALPLLSENAERLIEAVDGIDTIGDVREIVSLLMPEAEAS